MTASGFGGLEVACWPLVPKFAGSNLAEAVGQKEEEHDSDTVKSRYPRHMKKQKYSVHEYYVGRTHRNRHAVYSCKYMLKHDMYSGWSLNIVKQIRFWDVSLVTKT